MSEFFGKFHQWSYSMPSLGGRARGNSSRFLVPPLKNFLIPPLKNWGKNKKPPPSNPHKKTIWHEHTEWKKMFQRTLAITTHKKKTSQNKQRYGFRVAEFLFGVRVWAFFKCVGDGVVHPAGQRPGLLLVVGVQAQKQGSNWKHTVIHFTIKVWN